MMATRAVSKFQWAMIKNMPAPAPLDAPQTARGFTWNDVWRGFLPAIGGYVLAALSVIFDDGPARAPKSTLDPLVDLLGVVLFSATHAVLPVIFYRFLIGVPGRMWAASKSPFDRAMPGMGVVFGYLHMFAWFGLPAIGFAASTSWFPLAGAAAHIILARRGRRTWVFLEWGATSMSLWLFFSTFDGRPDIAGWAVAAATLQGLLLTLMERFFRPYWEAPPLPAGVPTTPQASAPLPGVAVLGAAIAAGSLGAVLLMVAIVVVSPNRKPAPPAPKGPARILVSVQEPPGSEAQLLRASWQVFAVRWPGSGTWKVRAGDDPLAALQVLTTTADTKTLQPGIETELMPGRWQVVAIARDPGDSSRAAMSLNELALEPGERKEVCARCAEWFILGSAK